ncbi:GNAT family N-acetyltransferase [Raineyella sp. W15-4]|uniref:GNAT family N-acetyltransferase n=1 Tax=Raineyella sp. W15-4 TaxID=3081651 RepID=UPI00295316DD|nr:GNAT family N-acetyltransferase [Raineyella sp. W15-4]WOQ16973.1 GNAT family N-acetyltransferase [Raineyella sp. W15-4]
MVDSTIEHTISRRDAAPLARLHRAAFPGFFLSKLGEPFLEQFYRGYVTDPTAVVAISRDNAGRPQGAAVGTTDPTDFFGRLLRRRFLGFVGASARATLKHPMAAPRLLKALTYRGDAPTGRQGALLSSICVDPTLSGQGIGSHLIRGWTRRAREMGAERAFLTTDAVGNESVNSWYLRERWVLSDCFVAHGDRPMNRYEYDLREVDEQS